MDELSQIKQNNRLKVVVWLMLVLILILSSVIVYLLAQQKTVEQSPPPSTTAVISTSPILPTESVTTIEWNEFELPLEKFTFKYPTDWRLILDDKQQIYTVISPNKFKLTFRPGLDGLGGGCDEECQQHSIENVIIDTLNFYDQPLYVVVNGLKDNYTGHNPAYIAFNVVPEKVCLWNICYGFKGKNSPGTTMITGSFGAFMPTNEFINSSDVKTALKILESIRYE